MISKIRLIIAYILFISATVFVGCMNDKNNDFTQKDSANEIPQKKLKTPADSLSMLNMHQFQEAISQYKNINWGDGFLQIGGKLLIYDVVGPGAECNGVYCIEENMKIYQKNNPDPIDFYYWKGLGFMCDVNNDFNPDFVEIDFYSKESQGQNYIYEADTFLLTVSTLCNKKFCFEPLKDEDGNNYFIKILWKGFFDEKSDHVIILEKNWPFGFSR